MRALVLVGALVVLVPQAARAGSDSLFTVGLGTSAGETHSVLGSAFNGELRVRLRALRLFGAEVAYAPPSLRLPDQRLYQPEAFRASGLLYVVPTSSFGLYLKGGLEAASWSQLRSLAANEVGYHAGGGLEVALGSHFTLQGELLFLGGFHGLGYQPLSTVGTVGVLRNVQENGFFDRRDYRAQVGLMFYL